MDAADYVNTAVFTVDMNGVELSFSKITGIGETSEYDTYVEGGGTVHIFPKPKTSAGTITFEKGITTVDRRTAVIFAPGNMVTDIQITLKKNGAAVETYYIESAFVSSWNLSELDALSARVAVNSFQLVHTGLRHLRR